MNWASHTSISRRICVSWLKCCCARTSPLGANSRLTPADRVPLDLDQSILLTLIANELLLNSLKHAFHGRAAGKVDAELRTNRDRVTLTVRDDGNGFVLPPTEIEEQRGTGMDLVQAMSRQLGGEFVINRMPAGGTCATICFSNKMSRQQPSVHL